jgi:hypothetical protein
MNTLTKIAAIVFVAGSCFAQNEPAPGAKETQKFFRLDFAVKEFDSGKLANTRKYSMLLGEVFGRTSPSGSIRSGDRVPVRSTAANAPNPQFSYIELGVNIDCRDVRQIDNNLALNIVGDVSTTASAPDTSLIAPILRNTKWSSSVIVPLKKTTVIFSSDDPSSTRQMQLELLATPIP